MDNLLTYKPIYNSRTEEKPKKKVIYKFKLLEEKKEPNYIRNGYIIKLDSLSQRFLSNSKPNKTKDYLPIINMKKILTIKNNTDKKENTNNKKNDLRFNKRYYSKDHIKGTSFAPYNKKYYLNISNTIIHNNITFTDTINTQRDKNINENNSKEKKSKLYFDELFEKNKKNDLKLIKLSKINSNKKILDESKKNESINNNISIIDNDNNNNNISGKDKIVLGSKYSIYDLSPETISKNIYYSRLNAYYDKINAKPKIKKINLSKLDLQNIKLKNYHKQKIRKYKKLINNTVEEVTGVKKNCLNWVNELREKYSDLYNGLGVEPNDKI